VGAAAPGAARAAEVVMALAAKDEAEEEMGREGGWVAQARRAVARAVAVLRSMAAQTDVAMETEVEPGGAVEKTVAGMGLG